MTRYAVVTGARGYVGTNLVPRLAAEGMNVAAVSRSAAGDEPAGHVRWLTIEEVEATDREPVLVHLAGISGRRDCEDEGTRAAARAHASAAIAAASAAGAKRAILASSIYATLQERGDKSSYGAHKLEIEEIFRREFEGSLVILRLPPVYGGANDASSIRTLAALVRKGFPLPLGMAREPRSYLAMPNLLDLVVRLVSDESGWPPRGECAIYEPSDPGQVTTRALVLHLAEVLGVRARLLPVPATAIRVAASLLGKAEMAQGAFGALTATGNERLEADFGWRPALEMPDTLTYLRTAPAA